MELLYEAKRVVAVAWAWAGLSKNACATAVTVVRTGWSVANVGIEKLC